MLLKDWKKVYLTWNYQRKTKRLIFKDNSSCLPVISFIWFNRESTPLFSEKESEQTEEQIQRPLWFEINRPQFEELTDDIYNNQDNKDFKVNINKRTYDSKNV